MGTVLPKTFTGKGYQVTVNADRSIIVKPGDWLSKYTLAIWGDASKLHIASFKRKIKGVLSRIDNPNLIDAGETLYVTSQLPGEIGIFPGEDQSGGALPGAGRNADNGLLEAAANEFNASQSLSGPRQLREIARGLMHLAQSFEKSGNDPRLLENAVITFHGASHRNDSRQIREIACASMYFAQSFEACGSDPALLLNAAMSFHNATYMGEPRQMREIARGLMYLAQSLKNFGGSPTFREAAVINFHGASHLPGGPPQMQQIALGLMQFARSLKT